MSYNSINNCMNNRQKLSMMAADLQQMAGATPNTYDEINNKMTDQQKLSLMASAIETIKNQGGGGKALTISFTESDLEAEPLWAQEYGNSYWAQVVIPTIEDASGNTYTAQDIFDMHNNGEYILFKNLPIVIGSNEDFSDPQFDMNNIMYINASPEYYSEWETDEVSVKVLGGHLEYNQVRNHDPLGFGLIWGDEYGQYYTGDEIVPAIWRLEKVVMDGETHEGLVVETVKTID